MLVLDPLEWIHRITSHVPDPARHCQRDYGAYSNRAIAPGKKAQDFAEVAAQSLPAEEDPDFAGETRRTWARLLRKSVEPGRRAGLEGMLGLAALTLEAAGDAVDDARIRDEGENLPACAARAQKGFELEDGVQELGDGEEAMGVADSFEGVAVEPHGERRRAFLSARRTETPAFAGTWRFRASPSGARRSRRRMEGAPRAWDCGPDGTASGTPPER